MARILFNSFVTLIAFGTIGALTMAIMSFIVALWQGRL